MTAKKMGLFDLRFLPPFDGVVLPLLAMVNAQWEREHDIQNTPMEALQKTRVAYRGTMRAMMRYDREWCRLSASLNAHVEDRIDQLDARYGVTSLDGVWSEWLKTMGMPQPLRVVVRCTDAQFRELRNALTPWVKLERQGGNR
jgi:hypothetical protein